MTTGRINQIAIVAAAGLAAAPPEGFGSRAARNRQQIGQGGLGEACPGKARHEEDRRGSRPAPPETKAFAPGSTAPGEALPRQDSAVSGKRYAVRMGEERQARTRPLPPRRGGAAADGGILQRLSWGEQGRIGIAQ